MERKQAMRRVTNISGSSLKTEVFKDVLMFFLIFMAPFLQAQNNAEARSIRLAWTGDEYALHYELQIEMEDENGFRAVLDEFTFASLIEVSLIPGKYRCRVIPYDYLEKPGRGSDWISFEVHRAVIPEPVFIAPPEDTVAPDISVVFAEPETVIDEIIPQAKDRMPLDIYISAAWMPLISLYGDSDPFFGKNIILSAAGLRLGMLYTKISFIDLGFELAGSWYFSGNHAATAGLNILARKRSPGQKTALNLKLGAGISIVEAEKYLHTNLGLSFLVFPHPRFYLEAGFDYTQVFTGAAYGELSGCLRPMLGAGFQF